MSYKKKYVPGIALLIIICLQFFSCTKTEEPILSLSIEQLNLSKNTQSITFDINCNKKWTITTSDIWLSVSPVTGTGNGTVTVNIAENTTNSDRTTTIKVLAAELTSSLVVTQKQQDALILTNKNVVVSSNATSLEVELRSNIMYDIIMPLGITWISQNQTKGLTDYNHTFHVSSNETYSNRETGIIFKDKNSSLADTLTITQLQKDGIFVAPDIFNLPSQATLVQVEVSANVQYDVIIPESVTWISQPQSKALVPYQHTFAIEENPLYNTRTSLVIFKHKDSPLADTLTINQQETLAFLLSTSELRIQRPGGSFPYTVSSNMDYTVSIVNGGTWLSQIASNSLQTTTYTVNTTVNTSGSERVAYIIFTYATGADTLLVRQYAFDGYYADIRTGETLESTVPQSERGSITRLKLVGSLVAEDFNLLRSDFRGVVYYHMSSVFLAGNAIPAGAFRVQDSPSLSMQEIVLPSSLLHIGENAFNGCSNLIAIILPSGITSIGAAAFSGCTSLVDVIIPSGVTSIGAEAFSGSSSLAKVTTRIQNPFAITNVFTGIAPNAHLQVPAGKVTTYQNTPGWGYDFFSKIYEEGTTPPADNISLTSGSIRSSGAGQTLTVTVEATGSWQVESKPSWITVTPSSGAGNQTVSVQFAPYSSTPVNRTGNVIFGLTGNMLTANLEVNQHNFPYNDGDYVKTQSSTIGNGIDLVFMGDGYTIEDIGSGQYISNITSAIGYFFDIEPYTTYRNYFDVYIVYAFSQESGIGDHQSTKNTKFETRYTNPPPSTSMTTNASTCFKYAVKAPLSSTLAETTVVLIANSTRYGGTALLYSNGQAIAICPMSTYAYPYDFRGLVQHEAAGHGFGKLADEYVTNQTTIPDSQKAVLAQWQGYNHFLNVDLTNNLSTILWKHFIGEANYTYVGAHEGGYNYQYGVWRPEVGSVMINNINYLNAPSREVIVKRIKQLSGMPYSFTDFKINDVYQVGAVTKSRDLPIDPEKLLPPPVLINVGR